MWNKWLGWLVGRFQKAYQETTQEIKSITSFFKKEAERTDRRLVLFLEFKKNWGVFQRWTYYVGQYKQR